MSSRVRAIGRRVTCKVLGPARCAAVAAFYDDVQWYSSFEYWRGLRRLRLLKDRHRGKRCFIIGNGPSLNRTNLSVLKEEYTFGLNRIYLLFDKMGFVPTYYVCMNPYVLEQSWREILNIPRPRFIGRAGIQYLPHGEDIIFVRSLYLPQFSANLPRGVWEGATVTYCAMQIAYYMGFAEVILIGVDHSFVTEGQPNALVVSQGPDQNHFDPNYFGQGVRWQLPDLDISEMAYKMARDAFEQTGRRILDATVGGRLPVFPKVSFDEIVAS
jgi:hypothetical protein